MSEALMKNEDRVTLLKELLKDTVWDLSPNSPKGYEYRLISMDAKLRKKLVDIIQDGYSKQILKFGYAMYFTVSTKITVPMRVFGFYQGWYSIGHTTLYGKKCVEIKFDDGYMSIPMLVDIANIFNLEIKSDYFDNKIAILEVALEEDKKRLLDYKKSIENRGKKNDSE